MTAYSIKNGRWENGQMKCGFSTVACEDHINESGFVLCCGRTVQTGVNITGHWVRMREL